MTDLSFAKQEDEAKEQPMSTATAMRNAALANGFHQTERFAVSTWSLHRTLGRPPITGPDHAAPWQTTPHPSGAAPLPLLELPAKLAAFGIHKLEICHFHLPTCEPAYLVQLRTALDDAGVTLWQLLIDGGDLTDPHYGERDLAWIQEWLQVAATLGATRARVSAGKGEPTAENLATSRTALARLAVYAAAREVRLMTENWQNLLSTPTAVLTVLDGLDEVGLLADFGNWSGPTKYADLAAILPRAESAHAKAHFSAEGQIDRGDYEQCLVLCRQAGFTGPYSLIYDGANADEWAGLQAEKAVITPYL